MPRSVALTGLIIVMLLSMVGFAAFSPESAPERTGIDVADLDASATAAVLAAPLVPRVTPTTQPAPTTTTTVPTQQARAKDVAPTTTTTTTTPRRPPPSPQPRLLLRQRRRPAW